MAKSTCLVCHEQLAKYKCPKCRIPFCSVSCSKAHKERRCEAIPLPLKVPLQTASEELTQQQQEAECLPEDLLLLKKEQLEGLDKHEEVQRKLNDDRLLAVLQRIDSSPNRVKELEKEMQDPAFLEFCDDVLEALGCKVSLDLPVTLEEIIKTKLESLASDEG